MARILIVGCGCRGRALARALIADGHAVRGTSRRAAALEEIAAAGAEPYRGDPARIGTLTYALDQVTLLCWLLGSAAGPRDEVAPLHGSRLKMLLERTIDTTVRGVVYEAAGTLDRELLAAGERELISACERSEIPHATLRADPADATAWLAAARAAVDGLLR